VNNNTKLTVACLGAGYFSQFHYDAWYRNPRVELIASADEQIEKALDTQATHAFNSLAAMLGSKSPDILDIVTPPNTHLAAITEAVKHDIKTIVCQKPFCTSVNEITQAITLAKSANINLVVHDNFRFQPWFRCMKQAIEKNLVGDVLQLTFRLRTGDGQGKHAYLERQPYFQTMPRLLIYETGVHYLDTFHYLLGPADTVYADLRTLNPAITGEDAGIVLLGYSDGKRAMFDGNRLLDHCSDDTRITFGEAQLEGTKGEITLKGNGEVALRRFGETTQSVLLEAQTWPGFAGDCVYALQDHIVNALLDGSRLENTAEDYLHISKLVDTTYASSAQHTQLTVLP